MEPSSVRCDDVIAHSSVELCDVQTRLRAALDLSFISGHLAHALSTAVDDNQLKTKLALCSDSAVKSGGLAVAEFASSGVAAFRQEEGDELPVALGFESIHGRIDATSNMVDIQTYHELGNAADDHHLKTRLALCLDSALKSGSLASAVFAAPDVATFWQESGDDLPVPVEFDPIHGSFEVATGIVQIQSSKVNVAELTYGFFRPRVALPSAEDGANYRTAQALRLTESKIQNSVASLQVVKEFKSSLYRICVELAERKPLRIFLDAHRCFDEFSQIVSSPNDPRILPGPVRCNGMFCGATLRNRTGIGGASFFCNQVMASAISDIAEDCVALSNLCKTVDNLFQAVIYHLGKNAEGVFRTFTSCKDISMSDGHERNCIDFMFLEDTLALTTLNQNILKLEALPSKIARVETVMVDTITRIDAFMEKAPNDVDDACQMPFPLSAFQEIIVGSNPALVEILQDKLSYVGVLDFKSVLTRLGKLSEDLRKLPFERVMQVLSAFAATKGISIDELHVHDTSDLDCPTTATDSSCIRNLLAKDITMESLQIALRERLREHDPMELACA